MLQFVSLFDTTGKATVELLGHEGLLAGRIHPLHLSEAALDVRGTLQYHKSSTI